MAEEARKELPQVYHVQSMVRRVGTRLHRAKSATRHRFKQWVNGRRLLRNQKMSLTAEQFESCKEQIEKMVIAGQVALFLPDGMRITSLPDGRLVYTKPNGATKIGEMSAAPVPAPAPAAAPPAPAPPPKSEAPPPKSEAPDDLTELPGVGGGRARKLESAGVTSFSAVMNLGVNGLMELLGLSEEAAEELHAAAEEMKG